MKGSEEKRDKKKIVYFSAKEGVSIRYLRRTLNLFDMSLTRDHQITNMLLIKSKPVNLH